MASRGPQERGGDLRRVALPKLLQTRRRRASRPSPSGAPVPGVIAPSPLRARPRRLALLLAATLLSPHPAGAQSAGAVTLPPDSAHWLFEGNAEVTEYL